MPTLASCGSTPAKYIFVAVGQGEGSRNSCRSLSSRNRAENHTKSTNPSKNLPPRPCPLIQSVTLVGRWKHKVEHRPSRMAVGCGNRSSVTLSAFASDRPGKTSTSSLELQDQGSEASDGIWMCPLFGSFCQATAQGRGQGRGQGREQHRGQGKGQGRASGQSKGRGQGAGSRGQRGRAGQGMAGWGGRGCDV